MGRMIVLMSLAATAVLATSEAAAQVRVQYGRITNVQTTTVNNSTRRPSVPWSAAASASCRAADSPAATARCAASRGAAAGRGVGTLAGRSQAFEYTVLVDGMTTVRVVSDQAGKRVGDCVAVEQGQFANIRLVPDSRCAGRSQPAPAKAAPAKAAPAPAPVAADVQQASACEQAKAQVLAANTDEEFERAERRMRLLCGE